MKLKLLVAMLLAVFAAGIPLYSQDVDIEKMEGYVNIDNIIIPADAREITEINLGPGMLNMLKKVSDDDGAVSQFSGLFSIQIKAFEISAGKISEIKTVMKKIEDKLDSEKWENIVRVNHEDQYTIVSMLVKGDKSLGTMIMSIDNDGEVVLANIVGNLNVEKLAEFGLGLDDSTMNQLREGWDRF